MPRAIVTDLDRTLTGDDLVLDGDALERIRQLRRAGLRVVIATGRRFDELAERGLPDEVDALVAENGAVVCVPGERVLQVIQPDFGAQARAALGRLAARFSWGRVVGSGPRELAFLARDRLVSRHVGHTLEFNAEEVMLLPAGVDKAAGAQLALHRLGLDAKDAWAIGDGENDVVLLRWAALGAAPANASPGARAAADVLLAEAHARGFLELTDPLLAPTA